MYQEIPAQLPADWKLRKPLSGGKAGRGHARTSNVQAVNFKQHKLKNFRFFVGNHDSYTTAVRKAIIYLESLNQYDEQQ